MQVAQFYELTDKLAVCNSFDELKDCCELFCQLTDIPYYLIGIIGQESSYAPTIRLLSNYPEEWLARYFKEGKQQADPVVKYIIQHQSPIRWDKLIASDNFNSATGLKVFKDAAEYGLFNGISIPLKSSSENIAVFSMAIGKRTDANSILDNAQMFCHTFATHLFERYLLIELSNTPSAKTELTKRELECLFWACEGKTAWEIAQIVGISERTILFHLNNSTTKLGAVNRQHAVALAIKKNLIKPNI
ncbi:LuxR family transcriptional regulator [Shewanella sp. AS16]|uniref:LuxR family transcriptional regulator n=1 Tax=Shewanella sp. AS16 TaxID=2907625 RepID=UPI001F241E2D|nr:LuxR family transcriptional regulator [Shewanella sp. AS16]MCE9687100.1 LuxR family transcriptional regulator [Shewanella sp. AS16]